MMKDMVFHHDDDGDTGEFLNTLGGFYNDVAQDLVAIATFGPELLRCSRVTKSLWQYERALGSGRRAIILFDYIQAIDAYIVLHCLRSGPEGLTRPDRNLATRRRRLYP